MNDSKDTANQLLNLGDFLLGNPGGPQSPSTTMTIVAVQAIEDGEIPPPVGRPDSLAGRLGDFGFRSGEKIEWLGRAPFGEPYFFIVRGATVALRLEEAKRLKVTIDSI
ncbi:MAG: ferrous iron transport protein A [Bdellovibrionaceae bacterium]|nr:ferrous iron transport protein A [Pseudobdellovibrionaceae bacterium]